MLYTNHSCDPNLAIQGQIVLVAMRDIAPGEELTIDWATTDDGDYEMECRCGSGRLPRHGDRQGLDEARAAGEIPRLVLLVPPAEDRRSPAGMSPRPALGRL